MFALSIIYLIIILILIIGLLKKQVKENSQHRAISVIVAARNEEKHILQLLKSLELQTYKNFELIIVDDRSKDNTASIILQYKKKSKMDIKLFKIENENTIGKKKAIELAISKAENSLLAFTDADCIVEKNWLKEINSYFDDKTDFICGFSELIYSNKFVTYLKNMERAGYLAAVAGAYAWNLDLSAAASNMAYRKELFYKAGGFEGIDNVKSGDDDLLLHKLKPFIGKLKFMLSSDSLVKSIVDKDVKQQYETEKRRASKWKFYPVWIKILTLYIFVFYIGFVVQLIYFWGNWEKLFILFALKIIPEFLLISIFLTKIKRKRYIMAFPIAELIYIPYFIYFGLKGLKGDYKWKD